MAAGADSAADLRRLARLHGVCCDHMDGLGERRRASPETLLAVLRSLGVSVLSEADAAGAVRRARQSYWRQVTDPVTVVTAARSLRLRVPDPGPAKYRLTLRLEGGEQTTIEGTLANGDCTARRRVEGEWFARYRLPLRAMPLGMHDATLELGDQVAETRLVVAPDRAPPSAPGRHWGVFLPLHALRRDARRTVGTLRDLGDLAAWAGDAGAAFVGVLPTLAAVPGEVSPYSPVSRRFWNGLYLEADWIDDVLRPSPSAPGVDDPAAPDPAPGHERLPPGAAVDYGASWGRSKSLLRTVAARVGSLPAEHPARVDFESYLESRPECGEYARFRAVGERYGDDWRRWPEGPRDGLVEPSDFDAAGYQAYRVEQWLADRQWRRLVKTARSHGAGLYLDLPIGVPVGSFDVWHDRGAFAHGCTVGAPPDAFFPEGQNWGVAPPHPAGARIDGYQHWVDCLRHHFGVARMLRIDHVMGLHRLFWIPEGGQPEDGTYVRYHADELYAVLALEAHRQGVVVIGEDLGTVPAVTRESMSRYGIRRTYVLSGQMHADSERALEPVPVECMAALETHDMGTFPGFWTDADLERRERLGRIAPERAAEAKALRRPVKEALRAYLRAAGRLPGPADTVEVVRAVLRYLAASPAELLVVNLEDLWGETMAVNVPGPVPAEGGLQAANWRRTASRSLSELRQEPGLVQFLREIDRLRHAQEQS